METHSFQGVCFLIKVCYLCTANERNRLKPPSERVAFSFYRGYLYICEK